MGHLLAIDAGTGGCRAVVFTDEGRHVADAGRRWSQPADPSNGCTTGLLDLASRSWAPELAGQWEVRTDLLPQVVEPGTVTGEVSAAAAAETGLARGVPVVMGGGDAQCAALGLGVVRPGQGAVVGGTFWQQLVNLDRPATDERARVRVTCHAAGGLWQAETIAFEAGAVVRWFLEAFCGEVPGGDAFEAMARQALRVPAGAEGVLAIFSNAMDYARWRHAAPSLLNLPVRDPRGARATLFRALLENAALVTRANLKTIESCCGLRPDLLAFGGGAARSELWARILADVLRRPVRVPEVAGATPLGVAILAGVGAGAFDDATAASAELAGGGRVYEPDPRTAAAYQDSFERWRAAYAGQLDLVERGVTAPLWTAPGGRDG